MTIRKFLGAVKCCLVDELPYRPLRAQSERVRNDLSERIEQLPPIEAAGSGGAEAHIYCGLKQMDMGVWSTWSLLRFLPDAKLFIHSDGSLEESHLQRWKSLIPNAVLVSRKQSDADAERLLADRFPLLWEWRRQQCYSVKFIDFHLYGDRDRIISLDSDVLCFRDPLDLKEALQAPQPCMRWHADVVTSYISSATEIGKCLGIHVSERVNTGLLVARRWSLEDFEYFEQALEKLRAASLPIFHHWAEQSLYAVSAHRHADAGVLPRDYSIYFGKTRQESVIRHYVGVIRVRPRFFVEGVPLLLSQIERLPKTGS